MDQGSSPPVKGNCLMDAVSWSALVSYSQHQTIFRIKQGVFHKYHEIQPFPPLQFSVCPFPVTGRWNLDKQLPEVNGQMEF